jgi:hypothetical protein
MRNRRFPSGKVSEIIALWAADKKAGVRALQDYMRVIEAQQAREAYHEFVNQQLMNDLYFSDEVEAHCDRLSPMLNEQVLRAEERQYAREVPPTHTNADIRMAMTDQRAAIKRDLTRWDRGA